jgi:dTDP-4-dehydrorhamnose reductase
MRDLPVAVVGRPELDLENVTSIDRVVAAVDPSAIINAAAYTAVDRAETETESAFRINSDGAAALAGVAMRRGIPFLHVSTDYVFDGRKQTAYDEDDIPAPQNVYGSSKLAGEIAVTEACPDAAIIRTSWLYSPYGVNFVRTMQRLSETQPVVRVVSDQRGTPTSAVDLADALLKIMEQLQSAGHRGRGGVYHLAGREETSWHGFAAAIFGCLARHRWSVPKLQAITTAEYPTPARRPQNSCLDSSRVERDFGVRLAPWQSALEAHFDQLALRGELAC